MTTPSDAPDWRTMSQEERDLGLNNGVAVVEAPNRRPLGTASTEMRARYSSHLDLRYGPRERNRIDFLKAGKTGRRWYSSTAATGSIAPRKFLPCLPRDRWRMASMSR